MDKTSDFDVRDLIGSIKASYCRGRISPSVYHPAHTLPDGEPVINVGPFVVRIHGHSLSNQTSGARGNNDHVQPLMLYTMCYNERMIGFTGVGATFRDWNEDIGEIKTVPMVKFLLILEESRTNALFLNS